jgi:hypothetical protein
MTPLIPFIFLALPVALGWGPWCALRWAARLGLSPLPAVVRRARLALPAPKGSE